MSLVGSGLHDKPYAFVDNELANDVLSEGALDFGSVRERGTPQKKLTKRVHGDEIVDLHSAAAMKLGPKRWLMERGLLGVAPAG